MAAEAAAAAALIAALLGLLPAQTSTGAGGRSQPGEAQVRQARMPEFGTEQDLVSREGREKERENSVHAQRHDPH